MLTFFSLRYLHTFICLEKKVLLIKLSSLTSFHKEYSHFFLYFIIFFLNENTEIKMLKLYIQADFTEITSNKNTDILSS